MSGGELTELEPNVTGLAALHLPRTGIVDYRRVCASAGPPHRAAPAGGELRTGERVVAIEEGAARVTVETTAGPVTCERRGVRGTAGGPPRPNGGLDRRRPDRPVPGRVLPARRRSAAGFVQRLIYPVPDPALPFLGVHLSPTITGDITVGPSAVLGLAREGYPKFSVNLRDVASMAAFPGMWRVAAANVASGSRRSATRCSRAGI